MTKGRHTNTLYLGRMAATRVLCAQRAISLSQRWSYLTKNVYRSASGEGGVEHAIASINFSVYLFYCRRSWSDATVWLPTISLHCEYILVLYTMTTPTTLPLRASRTRRRWPFVRIISILATSLTIRIPSLSIRWETETTCTAVSQSDLYSYTLYHC